MGDVGLEVVWDVVFDVGFVELGFFDGWGVVCDGYVIVIYEDGYVVVVVFLY